MEPDSTFAHPWRIATVSVVVLLVSGAVAKRQDVPTWELRLTRWLNSAPDWVAHGIYPVMQLGTVWAPIGVSVGILVFKRDWLLALATVATGFVAWFAAKGVKRLVERGRPLKYLSDIVVREGKGTGLGFVSGHSTVAAATAVLLIAALPARWRPLPVVLAVIVGLGRIVHGVHLPVDVIGGWAFGTLLGLGAVAIVDLLRTLGEHSQAAARGGSR